MENILRVEGILEALISPDSPPCVIATQLGIICAVNQPFEDLSGYSRRQLLGHPITVFIPERHRSMHEQSIALVGKDFSSSRLLGVSTIKAEMLCADGTEVDVKIQLDCITVHRLPYFVAIIRRIEQ